MGKTSIEWTDRTWNPIRGCSRVSEGCRNCYAEQVAARFSGDGQAYHGLARRRSNGEAQWTGEVRVIDNHMLDPLSWRTASRVFVNSMSDLFHEHVTDETIDQIFAVIALAPHHTFQILTKRPERMLRYFAEIFQRRTDLPIGPLDRHGKILEAVESIVYRGEGLTRFHGDRWWTPEGGLRAHTQPWPLPNVWLGVSVENQAAADERIPLLLQTPAAVRFLSCEPLLGPVDLSKWLAPDFAVSWGNPDVPPSQREKPTRDDLKHVAALAKAAHQMHGGAFVDWCIVGGESGSHARVLDLEWITDLVAQCDFAGVPCFVKQLGRHPVAREKGVVTWPEFDLRDRKGGDMAEWPEELRVREFPRALITEGK
jgi:protein gp37